MFYFLAIFTSLCFFAFVYFKDTFRRERSLVYQTTLLRIRRQRDGATGPTRQKSAASSLTQVTAVVSELGSKEKEEYNEKGTSLGYDVTTVDIEAQRPPAGADITVQDLKLSLKDIDLIKPIVHILASPNNLAILLASGTFYSITIVLNLTSCSGLTFAFNYSISYSCSRTLSHDYNFNALQIGLVLLTFGSGMCTFFLLLSRS